MNETRKKIIELIEPYMFKTLGKGCVCYDKDDKEYRKISRIFTLGGEKSIFDGFKEDDYYIELDSISGDISLDYLKRNYHIIGHYDITAVLKYLYSKSVERSKTELGDFDIFIYEEISISPSISIEYCNEDKIKEQLNKGFFFETTIPNKPLHLYTEEEEKELLDLLQKINKDGA